MNDFFRDLTQALQTPQLQSAIMTIQGTPLEVQQPILQQQAALRADTEARQAKEQARAMIEQIMSKEGGLTQQDILRAYMANPELGKALLSMSQQQQKQQTLQPVTLPDGTVMGYDKYSNTMYPAQSYGGSNEAAASYESDSMAGISPKGQREIESAKIAAEAPLTIYQQEQLRQHELNNQLAQEKLLREKQEKAQQRNEKKVKGLEFAEGYEPSVEDSKSVKQLTVFNENLKSSIEKLKGLTKKTEGIPLLSQKTSKDISNTMADIQLNAKGLFELGALQKADLDIINEMLVDPSSYGARLLMSNESVINSLDNFAKNLNKQYQNAIEVRGYRQKDMKDTQKAPEGFTPEEWGVLTDEERASWQP